MSYYHEILSTFERLANKPENYLSVQNDVASEAKRFLKSLYDHTKNVEDSPSLNALPALIIDEFDEEQIWQELELQNEETNVRFVSDVAHLVAGRNSLVSCLALPRASSESSDSGGEHDDRMGSGESGGAKAVRKLPSKVAKKTLPKKKTNKGQPSIVDDRFFKLNELSNFLDKEDRITNRTNKKIATEKNYSTESDSDDESVDYFQNIPSEDDDQEEEKELRYADFFDAPDNSCDDENVEDGHESNDIQEDDEKNSEEEADEGSDVDVETSEEEKLGKRVRFASTQSDSEGENASDGDDDSDGASVDGFKDSEAKSSFESRQERLRSRIDELEAKALKEKPWQLKGEVSAATRPQNSLLEEALEFDLTTRPAPIITEETTFKLEDIIRQRIKDKSWDDVERKIKPVETPFEYKKKLVLNQEKSKLSLAEVYEQEYIKQKEALNKQKESLNPEAEEKPEEEPESHKEIKKMMSSLFIKLDALSNFHYTPKPVAPDVQVVSNLPAITIEEVAPIGVSDAVLLAPEEVKAKQKGDLIGKDERTETDKKRERRRKKARQRERHLEQEKRKKTVEKLRPGLGNKYSKQKVLTLLKKAAKDKNVSVLEEKTKTIKSSKAFFNQLQEEVETHIKSKIKDVKKKNGERMLSAKKVKL